MESILSNKNRIISAEKNSKTYGNVMRDTFNERIINDNYIIIKKTDRAFLCKFSNHSFDIKWEINFDPIRFLFFKQDVSFDEFMKKLKENYPEDHLWILFNVEVLSKNFDNVEYSE